MCSVPRFWEKVYAGVQEKISSGTAAPAVGKKLPFSIPIVFLQQQFAHYEQVKRFTLLPEPFSMERGELTNTLKLKRSVVAKNYKELIDKMYEE